MTLSVDKGVVLFYGVLAGTAAVWRLNYFETLRCLKVKVKLLSRVWLFATPWTVTYQAPPSMGFSRQEYWSGWPFPPPGDLPNPGIEPRFPALEADTLPSEPRGKYKYLRCLLLLLLLTPTKQAWGDLPMGRSTRSFHQNVLVIFWSSLLFYNEDFPQQGIWVPRRFIPNSKNGCYWYFIIQYQKLHTILLLWGKTR